MWMYSKYKAKYKLIVKSRAFSENTRTCPKIRVSNLFFSKVSLVLVLYEVGQNFLPENID